MKRTNVRSKRIILHRSFLINQYRGLPVVKKINVHQHPGVSRRSLTSNTPQEILKKAPLKGVLKRVPTYFPFTGLVGDSP
jgi:hypothetical protein